MTGSAVFGVIVGFHAGGALGIAIFGSIGTAVYRAEVAPAVLLRHIRPSGRAS